MANVRGSCLCGGVKFEIIGPLMRVLNCHCSKCRSSTAPHFAAAPASASTTSNDCKARSSCASTNRRPTFTGGFAAPAARRSSTNRATPSLVSRSAYSTTTRTCGRRSTALSQARRRSLKSPILFLNLRSCRTPPKIVADRVWPRSSAYRLGTRCCALSRPEFRALDLTLDQTIKGYRRRRKCAYSCASLERRSKRWRDCSQ
jgi:hypothetical protein